MEFSCDRKSLLAAARRTAKAAASTTTVDALAGILLTADAENYELTLSATDLNIAITCTVTAPVVAGGSVVVGAKLFVEMLSLLKGQTVEIKLHPQHQLAVTSDTAGYLVACLPAEEFPSLNLPEQTETIELSGVKGLAKQTVFAAAKSGNLPMQCVKLELSGDSLRAIGCDGAVLSASRRELTGGKPVSLLIPAPSFSALAGSVGEEEKLLFSTDGKQAVFYSPEQDMTFATRLGSGTYLDADTVLSGVAKQYEALVDASEFRSALDRTITLSGTGSAYIVGLSSDDLQVDEADAYVKAPKDTGKILSMAETVDSDPAAPTYEKIKSGDQITVNGKTYEFVKDPGKTVADGVTKVLIDDDATHGAEDTWKNLQKALAKDGVESELYRADGSTTVTGLRFTDTASKTETVKSGGLTLQIADTADSFM